MAMRGTMRELRWHIQGAERGDRLIWEEVEGVDISLPMRHLELLEAVEVVLIITGEIHQVREARE